MVEIVKKHSNDKTIANYYVSFRKWLIISKQEGMLEHVRVPSVEYNYDNKEIIKPDELDLIIDHANNSRDKAIIALLWDSGCRVGELCSIDVKHIEFDMNGARVTIPVSKTKVRTVRVVFASSYLRTWLDIHNWKDNPNAPLFYSLRETGGAMKRLTDEGVRRQLRLIGDKLEKKGLLHKHIHPHLFRHSRASYIAEHNIMSEMQMVKQFGWEKKSDMPAIYITLADDSHEKAILKASGIPIEDDDKKELVNPIRCPRCKELNTPKENYCIKCNTPLSAKAIEQMERENRDKELFTMKIEINNVETRYDSQKLRHEIRLETLRPKLRDYQKALKDLKKKDSNQKLIDLQQKSIDKLNLEVTQLKDEIKRLDNVCEQEIQEIEYRYGIEYRYDRKNKPILDIKPHESIPDTDTSDELYDV